MNNFSSELIEVFSFIFEKLGIAYSGAKEDILPYVSDAMHKFATWKTYEYKIEIAICLFFIIAAVVLIFLDYNKFKTEIITGVSILILGIAIIFLIVCALELVEVLVFPEYSFYHWVIRLIKK